MGVLLGIFGVSYALIASEKIDKTIVACLAGAAVILLGYIPYDEALAAVDLNVVFLLIGMMCCVAIMATTGVFEWLAIIIAQRARGNGIVVFLLFMITTAVLSAFLDNVTTIILMAPVTILVAQILDMPAVPLLIMSSIFSNIGGAATLVGDPPNVLIGSQTHLTFLQFLFNLGPVILLILIVSLAAMVLYYRRAMTTTQAARTRIMKAQPHKAIIRPQRLWACLVVFSLVLIGFFVGHTLDIQPGIVALAGGFLMALVTRVGLARVLEKIEWSTIMFFVGLFILVGALHANGVFDALGHAVFTVAHGNVWITALTLLWVSAIASAMVDNIPLVIALIPLVHAVVPEFAVTLGLEGNEAAIHAQIKEPLFWSLALGACLGGNGSLVGASANVVVAQIAKKNKYTLTFGHFTRVGLPLMLLSLVMSSLYISVRYFM